MVLFLVCVLIAAIVTIGVLVYRVYVYQQQIASLQDMVETQEVFIRNLQKNNNNKLQDIEKQVSEKSGYAPLLLDLGFKNKVEDAGGQSW